MRAASASSAIPGRAAAATSSASSTRRHSRGRTTTASASSRATTTSAGCFTSALDLAIARNIRLGGSRNLQLRVEMFNAPNAQGITGRREFDDLGQSGGSGHDLEPAVRCDGSILPTRVKPSNAGFRAGDRLATGTAGAGADTILVLTNVAGLKKRAGCEYPALFYYRAWDPTAYALSLAGAAPRRFPPAARSGRRRFLSSLFEDLSYRRDTGIADRRISQIRLELTSHRNRAATDRSARAAGRRFPRSR